MRISLTTGNELPQRRMRPTPLYILTWTSLVFSVFILVTSVLDLGLWMNMSAAVATIVYHIAVLVLSVRAHDVGRFTIFTSMPTANCASILVFAWIAGTGMTVLALVIGRDEFPGPPPLVELPFPVHSAFQRRISLRPSSSSRHLLAV
ncbi:hypothetical protein B0H11DRAFT_1224943 [Mycena galericulata]|nr:hypothetical protein B0H11DRAFT_1224943 [Mycena galericulata]